MEKNKSGGEGVGTKSHQRKKQNRENTGGRRQATAIYVDFNLRSLHPDIERIMSAVNIDFRRKNIFVKKKDMQCWQSSSKRILTCVNNNLCVQGVRLQLMYTLKEVEKRLCRHGKLSTIEFYDMPLPDIHLSVRTLKEVKVPTLESKASPEYSFVGYPTYLWKAYFIETTAVGWPRIDGLLKVAAESNALEVFGPYTYILDAPPQNMDPERAIAHITKCRYSMG